MCKTFRTFLPPVKAKMKMHSSGFLAAVQECLRILMGVQFITTTWRRRSVQNVDIFFQNSLRTTLRSLRCCSNFSTKKTGRCVSHPPKNKQKKFDRFYLFLVAESLRLHPKGVMAYHRLYVQSLLRTPAIVMLMGIRTFVTGFVQGRALFPDPTKAGFSNHRKSKGNASLYSTCLIFCS